ncbi:autotransporter assembly complex protein TamA [Roseospirillum parvum]|uniref:autotransporter assembly complex protein TamA n=1 Tax=Roseospirillum parvum TaxID=83401 RepID=UPI001C40A358|nr:autotransporter assembly complex family protein [Roseospirillum parvum]
MSVAAPAAADADYETRISLSGESEVEGLESALVGSSTLKAMQDKPPATLAGLRRRAEGDLETLDKVLRAQGYYAAELALDITPEGEDKHQVSIAVTPGPRYFLAGADVVYETPDGGALGVPQGLPANAAEVGLVSGRPALAQTVLDAEAALVEMARNAGYPHAEAGQRTVRVDHARREMMVRLVLHPAGQAGFGQLRVRGLERTAPDFLRILAPWREGMTYDQRRVDTWRRRLRESGLFDSVQVAVGQPGPDGRVAITGAVKEAKQRTIGTGASYSSSQGPGVKAYWEDRNLFGWGETFRITGTAALARQGIDLNLRKPWLLAQDQDLLAGLTLERVDYEAYRETRLGSSLGVERRFNDTWSGALGVSLDITDTTGKDGISEMTYLAGLPARLKRDTTDSLLDPTEGSRLEIEATPYAGFLDGPTAFVVGSVSGSIYQRLDENGRFVAAARSRLGSIVGASTRGVPHSKRLYAGGGGSVRGYGHQLIGPLDRENDPTGGRGLAEVGLEMRIKITESIGIVPFLEGGALSDEATPPFDETWYWGAGLGARYYTPIGPLRLDVAMPLDRRKDIDDAYQIYISLGQAF